MKSDLTAERLRELLNYDPDTGLFTWRLSRGGTRAGAIAGCRDTSGHLGVTIDRRSHLAHRLAWLYVHGRWPAEQIDHINGVRDDNRLCNLREATNAENHQNISRYRTNTSGYTGVHWDRRKGRWAAGIMVDGRSLFLGRFATPEAAHDAYLAAKAELHTFQPTLRAVA